MLVDDVVISRLVAILEPLHVQLRASLPTKWVEGRAPELGGRGADGGVGARGRAPSATRPPLLRLLLRRMMARQKLRHRMRPGPGEPDIPIATLQAHSGSTDYLLL